MEFAKATTRPLGWASGPAAAEFEQMESDESYVDHFSGYPGDLYPIANSNAVFSDQEEIAGD